MDINAAGPMWKAVTAALALCALAAPANAAGSGAAGLEEIVVTAQRRAASIQDVPVAVTAFTATDLAERTIRDFNSYLATVPNAGYQETTGIGGEVKFRGIGTGINAQVSPTTAVYLGEVPVIHTGRNVNASYNFWLADLERVEVLRGPQGTLYGANSLGGAIKNVPARPELDSLGGQLEVSAGTVEDGSEDYSLMGVLNAPLGDKVAVRIVGYTVQQAGWYDNIFAGGPVLGAIPAPPPPLPGSLLPLVLALQPAAAAYSSPSLAERDTNETRIEGARATAVWQASDALSVTFMAAYEKQEADGAAFAEYPNPGTFPPFTPVPPIDFAKFEHEEGARAGRSDQIKLANLLLEYDLGSSTLVSSTSYWDRDEQLDLSLSVTAFPVTGIPESYPIINDRYDNPKVFTQEFRVTSDGENRLDWLAGIFYQKIDQDHRIVVTDQSGLDLSYYWRVALSQIVGAPPPDTRVVANNRIEAIDEQWALFGQLGYEFSERWRASAGFRWFTLDQQYDATSSGFQFGLAQGSQSADNSEDVFTPRLELTYTPVEGQLWYASASKGFRTGVVNRDLPQLVCGQELAAAGYPDGVPPSDADTVWNYEIGAKLELLQQRLRLNAVAYKIDWSDVQYAVVMSAFSPDPTLSQCQYDVVLNVGDASSQGVEVEAVALLTEQLRLDVAFGYTDAQFEDAIPALGVSRGDTMPLTPDMTAVAGLQYDFSVLSRPAYIRGEWSYVGRKAPFALDFPPFQYPDGVPFRIGDYDEFNLRVGMDLTDNLKLQLHAENLTNEFGITSANTSGGLGFPFVTVVRPRSYGATLRWTF